jgi:hypothetical protein
METLAWGASFLRRMADELAGTPIESAMRSDRVGIHLGIFVEPYLGFVLDGRKTVESRFGVQRCAPHGRVAPGDVLLLKRASGPVLGACRITETWFFDLRKVSLDTVRRQFARSLCALDPGFWQQRAHATLATLMRIDDVTSCVPVTVEKRDRRGWVTLRDGASLFSSVPA